MDNAVGIVGLVAGVALIVWGAETFAEHLSAASVRLGVSSFALALLLAGAEPEELATTVVASIRKVPAVAFGDVVGANIAICLVAMGVGALVAPLPFGRRVRRYALLGLPIGCVAATLAWHGHIGRGEGALLVALYAVYVVTIWAVERRPPALGETGEIEAMGAATGGRRGRGSRELGFVLFGVVAMAVGATVLVEAVRSISDVEATQTDLSLTVVGFVTAFELVVLAWSASRRGASEAVVAAVVGSFTYNATMSLGVAALVRPLTVAGQVRLRAPLVIMIGALALVCALAIPRGRLGRGAGAFLLALYPVFVMFIAFR